MRDRGNEIRFGRIQLFIFGDIIQNNKIVGCVTHVSGNNPMTGYGLYIDWMLEMDSQE